MIYHIFQPSTFILPPSEGTLCRCDRKLLPPQSVLSLLHPPEIIYYDQKPSVCEPWLDRYLRHVLTLCFAPVAISSVMVCQCSAPFYAFNLVLVQKRYFTNARVAGVGWLSGTAAESLRAFRERIFANFRDKNVVFMIAGKQSICGC